MRRHISSANKMHARLVLSCISVLLPLSGFSWAQAGSGSISGVVKAQDGSPVDGAKLTYGMLAPSSGKAGAAMLPPITNTTTGPSGNFSIQGLTAGTYLLCVEAVSGAYLNPCHWSTSPPIFTIEAGQAVSGAEIQLAKGSQLLISLSDPQQAIAAASQGTAKVAPPMFGAMAISGVFIPAVMTSSTTTNMAYTVKLPFDSPTNIFVSGGGFQLVDASATALATGGKIIQITMPSNGSPPSSLRKNADFRERS
jgi:hypothetical protein